MNIILSQPVRIEGEPNVHKFSKEYVSDIMPVIGARIEDPLWKSDDIYKITDFTINYYDNSCFVEVEPYHFEISKTRKDEFAKIVELHGWKSSWDFE